MKTLYIECNMGAAGDMLMAALYETLSKEQKVKFLERMEKSGIPELKLIPERVQKCGIYGTHMKVLVHGQEEQIDNCKCEQIDKKEHTHVHGHNHKEGYSHTHEHNHEEEHSHTHEHNHEEGHSHTHEHNHEEGHSHTHEHNREEGHSHMHEHSHEEEHIHTHGHTHFSYQDILEKIQEFKISENTKQMAKNIYKLIGDAEAYAHETTLENIHFHEVGSLDAIADVVGCSLLFEIINADKIIVSPIKVGNGSVRCAHGILPVPAPATAYILKGVPIYNGTIQGELCTPTGAAILKNFADEYGEMPIMQTEIIGYGMGQKDFDMANCVRVFLGEQDSEGNSVTEILCNLDDMTPEAIGYTSELLLNEGALDVFTTAIMMKKNRPAVLLTCLCYSIDKEKFTNLMLQHTSTLGVRYRQYNRKILKSEFYEVETEYGSIHIKISKGYGIERRKPEYQDIKEAADKYQVHYDKVWNAAIQADKE